MHPNDALSPKWRIQDGSINVIFMHPSTDWAAATMIYDDHPAIGLRWNGDVTNREDLGYPSARGSNGAWFILPDEVAGLVMALVGATRRDGPALPELFFPRSPNQPQANP